MREALVAFFVKRPCHRNDAQDENVCPPSNLHLAFECPNNYNPLYFPEMFPEVFSSPSSVCEWLQGLFEEVIHGRWRVFIENRIFVIVSCAGLCEPFKISFETVADSTFQLQRTLHEIRPHLVNILQHTNLPVWFSFSQGHHLESLQNLPINILAQSIYNLAIVVETQTSLSMAMALASEFRTFVNSVSQPNTLNTLQRICELSPSPLSLTQLMCRCVCLKFGDAVCQALRVPESRSLVGREVSLDVQSQLFGGRSRADQLKALKALSIRETFDVVARIHSSRRRRNPSQLEGNAIILDSLVSRYNEWAAASLLELELDLLCWDPTLIVDPQSSKLARIQKLVELEYGESASACLVSLKTLLTRRCRYELQPLED